MRPGGAAAVRRVALFVGLLGLCACSSTTDSLGYNGPGGIKLRPIHGPQSYPNVFRDDLGKSDAEIAEKIDDAFDQLFHGDSNQAIYFTDDQGRAEIHDIYHNDTRTEGMGYGMLICVQLNKRDEFDRLWRWAKEKMQEKGGPAAGYFTSFCDVPALPESTKKQCYDPFGLQQIVMALLFAHDRWGSETTNYGAEVVSILNLMRHKLEETDGGIVDGGVAAGALDTFDHETALVFDQPEVTRPPRTRPSIEMPAYYELWAQATGDPFWRRAASSARSYWAQVAHPETGLVPLKSDFEGTPLSGYDLFTQESYRTQINIVLDAIWTGGTPWEIEENNKLLRFFISQGINGYGSQYTLDGDVLNSQHDPAHVSANGISAVIATVKQRETFIGQMYGQGPPVGSVRYYQGLFYLLALLIMGGQMIVY